MGLLKLTSHHAKVYQNTIFLPSLISNCNNKPIIHHVCCPIWKRIWFDQANDVSDDLAAVVGMKEASRAQCIKMLWKYLKDHNLQDPENKQYFFPDKKMGKIFGNERIRAFGMAKFLGAHLTPI